MKPKPLKYTEPEIVPTRDGSNTLRVSSLDETYHSTHGALQESLHVFIKEGLHFCTNSGLKEVKVFEMGFGTGLNAFLTLIESIKDRSLRIEMHSIEKYPVFPETILNMEFQLLDSLAPWKNEFEDLIHASWNEMVSIKENFEINKISEDFFTSELPSNYYDLIYYDAFGARAQEAMWREEAFAICAEIVKPGGVLVTYASKGSARRALEKVGFAVENIPGPPGKREMMRATYK